MRKLRALIILALVTAIIAGGILFIIRENTSGGTVTIVLPTPGEEITVYVTGAVQTPGVYTLGPHATIADAVQAAGGFSSNADPAAINLAGIIRNGAHVHVYSEGEASQRVNINTADSWLLEALPGIGEKTAQKIIECRTTQGPFESIEQLVETRIVTPSTFEKIKDKITVH
mgnify:CR=1 FL=1